MKEYDRVVLKVEKEKYAVDGVHKGMDGWICDSGNINGLWLVSFDQYGDLPEIACILVNEYDLELLELKMILNVEKEEYAKYGLHKGMIGTSTDILSHNEGASYYFFNKVTGEKIGLWIKFEDFIPTCFSQPLINETIEQENSAILLINKEDCEKIRIYKGMIGILKEQIGDSFLFSFINLFGNIIELWLKEKDFTFILQTN